MNLETVVGRRSHINPEMSAKGKDQLLPLACPEGLRVGVRG